MGKDVETWAWSTSVDTTSKIVLVWLARTETEMVSRSGPTAIAELANISVRSAERAFQRLENANFISRIKRGVYAIKTVTSDGPTVTSDGKRETVTSVGPDRHQRGLLARADLNNNNNKAKQEQLFTDSEWVTVIHNSTWTTTQLTSPQIAQVEKKYASLDLVETAMRWENWHSAGKGKRRRPKDIYRSFTNWLRKEMQHGETNAGAKRHSAISSKHRFSGDSRPRDAGTDWV